MKNGAPAKKEEERMILKAKSGKAAQALFHGWQETMIWSCLEGTMGEIYLDHPENPTAAMALLGDFRFFAGVPCEELIGYAVASNPQEFMLLVPRREEWAALIERRYQGKAKKRTRYAFYKDPEVFDQEKLRRAAQALPQGYALHGLDEPLYYKCREIAWCKDWVAQYESYEKYRREGLGVVILKDGEPVAGASSYSSYNGGIEIEIDTAPAHRRKGLACRCAAQLILECLARGIYPSWDAHNEASAALAKKLGYRYSHAYAAYEIQGG